MSAQIRNQVSMLLSAACQLRRQAASMAATLPEGDLLRNRLTALYEELAPAFTPDYYEGFPEEIQTAIAQLGWGVTQTHQVAQRCGLTIAAELT